MSTVLDAMVETIGPAVTPEETYRAATMPPDIRQPRASIV